MKVRKQYIAPRVTRVEIDNTISLVMMTVMPPNPPPRPRDGGNKDKSPFSSPFQDKPFN